VTSADTPLAAAEQRVRTHESDLRRELRTFDLVLAQLTYIITLEFFGAATKAGPAHAILWIVAIALFFVPQAIVVTYLNDRMPLEGGLYEWARIGFGDGVGFLVAWNLWLYIVLLVGEYGFVLITYIAFAIGPGAAWMAASKPLILASSVLLVSISVVVSAVGLKIGKWIINTGSLLSTMALVVLIALAALRFWRATAQTGRMLPLVRPPLTFFSLSVFSKMTFGALCGLEFVAILAGECRNPAQTIRRSVAISAPLIAAFYILVTSAIQAFIPAAQIDLIGPVPQALSLALQPFGLAKVLAPMSVLLLFANVFCTGCLTFSGSARLPMVAGWEGILPAWFTRLHPKYRTPINSTFFAGVATLTACVIALAGVNPEEAFSLIQIWGFTLYGLAYLAMFALPLLAGSKLGIGASSAVKLAAASGFVTTLLFVVLSIFPVIDVPNPASYAWKTIAVVIGVNLVGAILYLRARQRSPRFTG
jgi:glutamate:GABA antiporter